MLELASLNPESEYFYGIQIQKGMRMKDLPDYIKTAGIPHEGALHPFIFKSGKFFHLEWVQEHLYDWPIPIETEVLPGDYLVMNKSGGIVHLKGEKKDDIND